MDGEGERSRTQRRSQPITERCQSERHNSDMATSNEQGGKLEKKDGEAEEEGERRREENEMEKEKENLVKKEVGDGGEDGISLRIELYT